MFPGVLGFVCQCSNKTTMVVQCACRMAPLFLDRCFFSDERSCQTMFMVQRRVCASQTASSKVFQECYLDKTRTCLPRSVPWSGDFVKVCVVSTSISRETHFLQF